MRKIMILLLTVLSSFCLSACGRSEMNGKAASSAASQSINENVFTANSGAKQAEAINNQSKTSDVSSKTAHIHSFSAATCTSPSKCQCGLTKGKALGHDCSEATCTLPKKCKRCGISKGDALGHDYKFATCTSPKRCNRCGVIEGEALGHTRLVGRCDRCNTFFDVDVKLPSTPIIIEDSASGKIQINQITYEFEESAKLTVNFCGEKISGGGSKIAFNYKLSDAHGLVYMAGYWEEDGYNIGDMFEDKKLTFQLHGECREYSFEILSCE